MRTPSEKDKTTRRLELLKTINRHKSKMVRELTRAFIQTEYIVERNYNELQASIKYHNENYAELWNRNSPKAMNEFMNEFGRVLHNYLASIFTLVEHSRVFVRHLKDNVFERQYEERVADLINNDVILFMQKLRVYGQHYAIGAYAAQVRFEGGSVESLQNSRPAMILQREELLEWDGWKHTKDYLESLDKDIDIQELVEEYQREIHNFYGWFHRRLSELYSSEIAEYIRLASELQSLS